MFNNSFSDTFNNISQKFDSHILMSPLFKYNAIIEFSYREFLSNSTSIAANLVDNNAIKLLNSKKEVQQLMENSLYLEPAKIVVIYDLLGNVINPGIELSEDEKLSTSSDAIFDSEQTIILRTK